MNTNRSVMNQQQYSRNLNLELQYLRRVFVLGEGSRLGWGDGSTKGQGVLLWDGVLGEDSEILGDPLITCSGAIEGYMSGVDINSCYSSSPPCSSSSDRLSSSCEVNEMCFQQFAFLDDSIILSNSKILQQYPTFCLFKASISAITSLFLFLCLSSCVSLISNSFLQQLSSSCSRLVSFSRVLQISSGLEVSGPSGSEGGRCLEHFFCFLMICFSWSSRDFMSWGLLIVYNSQLLMQYSIIY